MLSETTLKEYQQFQNSSAWTRLSGTVVEITGADRQTFLHNFCTNEIKRLEPGNICEAFVLNGKGKTIGHMHVLNTGDSLLLFATAPIGGSLIEHLDRYVIREDVQLTEVSSQHSSVFLFGPDAGNVIANQFPIEQKISPNRFVVTPDSQTLVAHVELAGWGYLIIERSDADTDAELSVPEVSGDALEMLRIKHATPWFGRDIDESNLPQELLRDDKAISFVKGCYLGQETVARIDAIGKVNRVMVTVSMDGQLSAGAELMVDDKPMGKLTSVAWSPENDAWIGMAIVRRPHETAGSVLTCGETSVTVKA